VKGVDGFRDAPGFQTTFEAKRIDAQFCRNSCKQRCCQRRKLSKQI
jgi:hypothetical protein